ncbi:hypothetical protein [Cyanobium sp. NS01]|uniref:hypothetical protein n=1 Tax=Cyanobium sp. NS01 TaxID=261284 RepID=UPI0016475DAC|nr:hypothetical protein [Cyanobium sp. NS01]QNI71028.1 hypothetical protein CyaNS01_01899 [Cyanobium sp. NS01]
MSLITPDERRLRVSQRVSMPLAITFLNLDGGPSLSLLHAPTTMVATVTNRSARPLIADSASRFSINFRPHTVVGLSAITLGEDSAVSWRLHPQVEATTSSISIDVLGIVRSSPTVQTLTVSPRTRLELAPGDSWHFRLEGVTGDPLGGSRQTRACLDYAAIGVLGDVDDAAAAALVVERINGQVVQHLWLRRADDVALRTARAIRSGSTSSFGPFTAGFTEAPSLLNDGKALNQLTLRIVNTSNHPIRMSGDSDIATRFVIEYRIGNDPGKWGLLRSRHDHITVTTKDPDWTTDGVTVRRIADGAWTRQAFLDIDLEIHTSAPEGTTQIIARYENLPDDDDGELILLADIAPSAHNAFVEPLQLWGNEASLDFHAGEYLAVPGIPSARIKLDHGRDFAGHDRRPLQIEASSLDVHGSASITGALTVQSSLMVNDKIGINTTDPKHQLDVHGSASITGALTVQSSLMVNETVTAKKLRLTEYSTDAHGRALVIGETEKTNLRLGATRTYAWIQSHGRSVLALNPIMNNVGINTTDPKHALDVSGSGHFTGQLEIGGSLEVGGRLKLPKGWEIAISKTQLKFKRNDKTLFLISTNGGIANISGKLNKLS